MLEVGACGFVSGPFLRVVRVGLASSFGGRFFIGVIWSDRLVGVLAFRGGFRTCLNRHRPRRVAGDYHGPHHGSVVKQFVLLRSYVRYTSVVFYVSPVAFKEGVPRVGFFLRTWDGAKSDPHRLADRRNFSSREEFVIRRGAIQHVRFVDFAVIRHCPVAMGFNCNVQASQVGEDHFFLQGFLRRAVGFKYEDLVGTHLKSRVRRAGYFWSARGSRAVNVDHVFKYVGARFRVARDHRVVGFVQLSLASGTDRIRAINRIAVV